MPTIFLVHLFDLPEVFIILNRFVVRLIFASQGSKFWARKLGQRTENKTVYCQSKRVKPDSSQRQPKNGEDTNFQETEHLVIDWNFQALEEVVEMGFINREDELDVMERLQETTAQDKAQGNVVDDFKGKLTCIAMRLQARRSPSYLA